MRSVAANLSSALTTLPELPASLTILYCYSNWLTSLPILPPNLLELDCSRNQFASLPSLPKSTAIVEHFYWSQGHWNLEDCISTLEALARNPSDHSECVQEYEVAFVHLKGRCQALARLYGNPEFNILYDGAVNALAEYKGRETGQTKAFVQGYLRKYGFFITPRMWSKLEILLIMCVLLDTSLVYQSINQKTGHESTEHFQNR